LRSFGGKRSARQSSSTRRAIGIWLLLSVALWLAIAELAAVVSGWGSHSIDADVNELSKIAPAAGKP